MQTLANPQSAVFQAEVKDVFWFNADGNTSHTTHRPITALRPKSGFSFSSLPRSLTSHYTFLLCSVIANSACGDQIRDLQFAATLGAARQHRVEAPSEARGRVEMRRILDFIW